MRPLSAGGKITEESPYSFALSVFAEAAEGYRFKLLLEHSSSETEFNAAVALFLEFLEAYHAQRLDGSLAQELRDAGVVGRTILIGCGVGAGSDIPIITIFRFPSFFLACFERQVLDLAVASLSDRVRLLYLDYLENIRGLGSRWDRIKSGVD